MTYISSQSLSLPMRLSVMQAQSALAQAQTEVSTGVKADIGLSLGARTGLSLSLKGEVDRLTSFTTTNALATTRLDSTSNALDAMLTAAQKMSTSLITASNTGTSGIALQNAAQTALQGLVSGLNTSAGGRFVFGGINTDTTPVATYTANSAAKQAVDTAFQSAFGMSPSSASASSISGTDMQSFLDTQFSAIFDQSGWQTNWSAASSQAITSDIAPSQSVTTSVSANDTAFRQMAQAYTMLSEFAGQNVSDDARAAVVATASKLVGSAIAGLTNAQSAVGIAQSSIESTNTRLGTQIDMLKSNVGDLDGVDPYALSAKITQLQTQLESSYALTNRLSGLSLVNYLR